MTPDDRELRRAFYHANHKYFRGRLPTPRLFWQRLPQTYAEYEAPRARGRGAIYVNPRLQPPAASGGWRGLLLHEMVHLAVDLTNVDEFDHGSVAWHGPVFTRECNRIGRVLGIPDTNEEDSWAWPWGAFDPDDLEPTADE